MKRNEIKEDANPHELELEDKSEVTFEHLAGRDRDQPLPPIFVTGGYSSRDYFSDANLRGADLSGAYPGNPMLFEVFRKDKNNETK